MTVSAGGKAGADQGHGMRRLERELLKSRTLVFPEKVLDK